VDSVQKIYARWLGRATGLTLGLLVICFFVYVLEVLDPHIALHHIPGLWKLSAAEFVTASGAPKGWGWTGLLHTGDYLTFGVVAMLCSITLVCYVRIIVELVKQRERLHAALAAVQVLILLGAISGFVAGHH
jgi:hypothetical protein